MWKVGDVAPVSVLGMDGYPYGFNLTTEEGKALVSFAYVTRTRAEGYLGIYPDGRGASSQIRKAGLIHSRRFLSQSSKYFWANDRSLSLACASAPL